MSEKRGRVAVLGKGGREHGIALRLAADIGDDRVLVVPGNPGVPFATGPLGEGAALAEALRARGVDLVVIGPEALLSAGVADALRAEGFPVVGPGAAGARLEGSKAFAKDFFVRHGLPTARVVHTRGVDDDDAVFAAFPGAAVAKYDGLAEGKGVTVCESSAELRAALADLRGRFGPDAHVLIEERLVGPELSVLLVLSDGAWVELPEARDHKRLLDHDGGPNTGGMGAFSPVLAADDPLRERIRAECVRPAVAGLVADGIDFRGFLFIGLMLTPEGPKVLEFNTRLGDPETQVILPRVRGDFFGLLAGCAAGALPTAAISIDPVHTVGVVAARRGYPGPATPGVEAPALRDLPLSPAGHVVGGAALDAEGLARLPGGRALTLLGQGPSHQAARDAAYGAACAGLDAAPGAFPCRMDVGRRPRLAVFASGGGSNLRAIVAAARDGALRGRAEVALVLSDRPRCGAVAFAVEQGITAHAAPRAGRSAEAWEQEAALAIEAAGIDLLVLAGFMRVLSPAFVRSFAGRIINIHPADTREHQGLGGYEDAFARGATATAITVHLVDEGLDTGPVLARAPVDLRGAADLDAVRARGLAVEHALYPEVIRQFLSGTLGAPAPA